MKNVKRIFVITFMLAFIISISSINAFAATVTQDNLEVTLVTDKEKYAEDEQIKTTLTVKNNNDTTVTNVDLETALPDGYKLADKSENKKTVDSIAAGESVSLNVVLEKDSTPAEDTVPEKTTTPEEDTVTEKTTTPEEDTIPDKRSTPSEPSTDSKSSTNPVNNGKNDDGNSNGTTSNGSAVQTGQNNFVIGLIILFVLVACFTTIFILKRNATKTKSTKAILSILLSCLIVTSSFSLFTIKTNAVQESPKNISITQPIKIGSTEYQIKSSVNYTLIFEPSPSNSIDFLEFYSDTSDILVGKDTLVSFYANVSSENVLPNNSVFVYDEQGMVVSEMFDNGENGDETANDGVFTAQVTLKSNKQNLIKYYASYQNIKSTYYSINYYLNLSDEELLAGDSVMDSLSEIASKYRESGNLESDTQLAIKSYEEIINYLNSLKEKDIIVQYDTKADGIHFIMPGNLEYCFFFECLLSGDNVAKNKNSTESVGSSINDSPVGYDSFDRKDSRICVLKPFNWQHANSNLDNSARRIINTGLPYKYENLYENNRVTVELFKNLGDYHVILLDSHGGENSICTGESPTDTSLRKYSADWQAGRIQICQVSNGGNRTFYALTDEFFSTYYPHANSFNNTLFYIGTCHGADSPSLSTSLTRSGMNCVLAYENSVYTDYCEEMCEEVVSNLCTKESNGAYCSVEKAVQQAKDSLGDTDRGDNNWWMQVKKFFGVKPAELQICGNSNFKISSSFLSGLAKNAYTNENIASGVVRTEGGTFVAKIGANSSEDGSFKDGSFTGFVNSGSDDYKVCSYGFLSRIVKDVNVSEGSTTYLSESRLIPGTATDTFISGLIQSATTSTPISNAKLVFRKDHNNKSGEVVYSTNTDENGTYSINSLPVGYYTMEISADGYITQYSDILVGTRDNETISLSSVMSEEKIRIVLTWNEDPSDLDSHLVGTLSNEETFEVYYGHKHQEDDGVEICNLDVDDTTSFGPETITIQPNNKPMYYFIHRYAGNGTVSSSGAQIKVYQGSNLLSVYNVPTDAGNDDYWNVFAIKNGQIINKNTITSSADTNYAN